MAGQLPALFAVTKDDVGPYIATSGYIWASLTLFAGVSRFTLAFHRKLGLQPDDLSFAFAVMLVIGDAITYHLAAKAGLGQHISALTADNGTLYFKRIYAAQLLALAAIGAGKLSAVLLSNRVAAQTPSRLIIMLSIVAAWTTFSLLATAFQCQLPNPWQFSPANCPSRGALQYVVTASNMVTDIMIAVWIVPELWKLNTAKENRVTAIVLFSMRIIVPFVCIGQLVTLTIALPSDDQPWDNAPRAFLDQSIVGLSVITATVPRINRLLSNLTCDLNVSRITEFELEREQINHGRWMAQDPGMRLTPPTGTVLSTMVYGSPMNPSPKASETSADSQSDGDGRSLNLPENAIFRTRKFSTKVESTRDWRNIKT